MSSQKWHPRKVIFLRSHGGKPRLLSAGNTTLTIISYLNNGNWNHVETSAHQCTHSTPGSDCKWRAVSQLSFFTFCFLPQFTWGWEGALTFGWVHPRCTTTPSTNGNGQSSASPNPPRGSIILSPLSWELPKREPRESFPAGFQLSTSLININFL